MKTFALSLRITLLILAAFPALASAEENDRFARLVLFIAEDADAPKNYDARLASLAFRTEAFLGQWMKHWNRPVERPRIFSRTDGGSIEVTLVKGNLLNPKGRAALPELRKKAVDGAMKQLALSPRGAPVIWWIFYDYPGVKGFQGGARGSGGLAINAYPEGEDLIEIEAELAEGKLADMAIKGTIHEFGHALGLPHIGPRPDVDLGNSLMGPINRAFWNRTRSDDVRVCLSEASAAALWKHPIFRLEKTRNPSMPESVSVENFEIRETNEGKSFVISGHLRAGEAAHSIVAYDSERGRFGDYWARTYVAPVDPETGAFEVGITKPFGGGGRLYLSFNFDSGVNTSDGQKPFQQGSSISIQYSGEATQRKFQRDSTESGARPDGVESKSPEVRGQSPAPVLRPEPRTAENSQRAEKRANSN